MCPPLITPAIVSVSSFAHSASEPAAPSKGPLPEAQEKQEIEVGAVIGRGCYLLW